MKTFTVGVREVWCQLVEVEAESFEEAKRKIYEGEGNRLDNPEYTHTLDSELWSEEE